MDTNYKYKVGEQIFFIESNFKIREGSIVNRTGEFYVIRFKGSDGGLRLRESRLFSNKEEAEKKIPKPEKKAYHRTPYDYGY